MSNSDKEDKSSKNNLVSNFGVVNHSNQFNIRTNTNNKGMNSSLFFHQFQCNRILDAIVQRQVQKVPNYAKKLQISKLFGIIYVTLKKQSLDDYFSKYSLIPSTQTKEELIQKYFLFHNSYIKMTKRLVQQYQPYLSDQFKTQFKLFKLNSYISSFLRTTWWLSAIGLSFYASKRMNYKWRNLTMTSKYFWKSIFFLYMLNQVQYSISKRSFSLTIQRNINLFDSIVKTQEYLLLQSIKKHLQKMKQTNDNNSQLLQEIIRVNFPNYQTITPPSKQIY